jgi:small nuclear ribonucleoprotein (snRNP)-like protein
MEGNVFPTLFKALKGYRIIIELKNNVVMKGIVQHTDNFLNIKLGDVEILNADAFPQMPRVSSAFIRGSAVGCVHLPPDGVDLPKMRAICRAQKPS